ncbi:hypothetical protein M2281_003612 [Mesorhizobium soli]|uniref:DUF4440 domain-containing protein n=1 Tax=Pseudaminobacter soli (ex Li et al. 2025) TaxID=1295366 RepID=UPI0024737A54|nr:DUF4440 domain-containing protein [Mesorhizobium soli]MDH6233001.1 hypothetical protein [Mesorhizobium soli]
MTDPELLFREVIDTHVEIERWFTGDAEPDHLAGLINRFSPEFRMISIQGMELRKESVGKLFERLHGKRPGLRIAVDEMQVAHVWPGGACVTYRETHVDASGDHTVRRSTVLLEISQDRSLLWRHLHETPVVTSA